MSVNHIIVLVLSVIAIISFVSLITKFEKLEKLMHDRDIDLLVLGILCLSFGLFAATIAGLGLLRNPPVGHTWANWGSALLTISILSFWNLITHKYKP